MMMGTKLRNEEEKSDQRAVHHPITTKDHRYDGLFCDRFIAPNQDPLYRSITGLIDRESRVLDVGRGTGRLAWRLSEQCRLIHGIDPSPRNMARATGVWEKRGRPSSVTFSLGTLEDHIADIREP